MRRAAVVAALLALAGCGGGGTAGPTSKAGLLPVTITAANGAHVFHVERAKTAAEQQQGLMFRTDIPQDGGMLFWPYPPDGSGAAEASFWMKNTPTSLDIVYIRKDGTIARIAENTVPFDQTQIRSGEPVGAVLEIRGGTAASLDFGPGDKVSWAK